MTSFCVLVGIGSPAKGILFSENGVENQKRKGLKMLMKPILILVLTICLNGCKKVEIVLPKIVNHERCVPLIIEETPGLYRGKCRCHEYQVTPKNIGRVSESIDYELGYCSNKISFSPTTWSDEYLYFFDEIFFMAKKKRQKARANKYDRKIEEFFNDL